MLVERRLREAGVPFRPAAQMVGTEAVKKAVESNLGLAFVSGYSVEGELALGRLLTLEVEGLAIARPIVMVYRSQRYFTPAAQRFREFVLAWTSQPAAAPAAVAAPKAARSPAAPPLRPLRARDSGKRR